MKKSAFSLAIFLLFAIAMPALASAVQTLGKTNLNSIDKHAGTFEVQVLKGDQRQHAGILEYNKYFRENKIDLSKFLPAGGPDRFRIAQKGGGATHIDSILLGGLPPSNIRGSGNKFALKKLLKRDFDVLNTFEKPFFKVLCQTDSGHPNGFTYSWVTNDEQSLYVDLDFTLDDTRDGNKGYTKLYVKTDSGLKAFKVSEDQNVWGKPEFTYSDKVSYQHKTYNFIIPLEEL